VKTARVNAPRLPILSGPGGMGGATPAGAVALADLTDVDLTGLADGDVIVWDAGSGTWIPATATPPDTTLWVPVMTEDTSSGLWYVAVTGDGDAVMTEVPL